eukprot:TRINITY_DN5672_c0_g1_i3.p1 TRINITY_DN5672_c0_g1~~TRINITY_DN5672_c0_g1_i3.p1  ORF type:complete len:452 (-),score=83.06 TRINITY_DN5672_c0_g1_i3:150-1505(-)
MRNSDQPKKGVLPGRDSDNPKRVFFPSRGLDNPKKILVQPRTAPDSPPRFGRALQRLDSPQKMRRITVEWDDKKHVIDKYRAEETTEGEEGDAEQETVSVKTGENGETDDAEESEEVQEDLETQLRLNRELLLQMMYYGCLLLILGAVAGLCAFGFYSLDRATEATASFNQGGRQRAGMERMLHFARELTLSDPAEQLLSGQFTINTTSQLRTYLGTVSQNSMIAHHAMLYGTSAGWVDLPASRGWPQPQVTQTEGIFSLFPYTFEQGKRAPGEYQRHPYLVQLEFQPMCWSIMPIPSPDPRLNSFFADYTPNRCVYFRQGDVVLLQGLHQTFESVCLRSLSLSKASSDLLVPSNEDYQFLAKYNDEIQLGIGVSLMIYLYDALNDIDTYSPIMIVFAVLLCLLVLVQYRILGNRVPEIMGHNVALRLLITRLIQYSNLVFSSTLPAQPKQ